MHPVLPCNADDTDPGAHAVQFCAPCTDENDPAGQMVHTEDPGVAKYPAGHAWQLEALADPVCRDEVPAGHEVQLELPHDSEYFPAVQDAQVVLLSAFTVLDEVPGRQRRQASALCKKLPEGHGPLS